ncbi:MAG: hypothetical protein ACR2MS_06905 [Weeksellaceae bacterium]
MENKIHNNVIYTILGGISAGIISKASGGAFWQGFRMGAITAGLNHVREHGKRWLSFKAAKLLYQKRFGKLVRVDADAIDWSNANLAIKVGDNRYRISLLGMHYSNLDDGLVHGNLIIERVGKSDYFRISEDPNLGCRCDTYDFEQYDNPWFSENYSYEITNRNIKTFLGQIINSTTIISNGITPSQFIY